MDDVLIFFAVEIPINRAKLKDLQLDNLWYV